jgi:ABC-type phosphate/phosphonate transport system substrate-binding protein
MVSLSSLSSCSSRVSRARFALLSQVASARTAFEEMAAAVEARAGVVLEPIYLPSHAALARAIEEGECEVAWSPPIVAQDLLASGGARALAAVECERRSSYYAVLLARGGSSAVGADALVRAHVGWVSKKSAAGYAIPFLYLRSLGIEPDEVVGRQSFVGSHERVLEALADGEIDLGATYARLAPGGRMLVLPEQAPRGARVVIAAGPISGEVILASAHVDVQTRRALRGALLGMAVRPDGALARSMDVERFEAPTLEHFETTLRWRIRALSSEPRVLAAS